MRTHTLVTRQSIHCVKNSQFDVLFVLEPFLVIQVLHRQILDEHPPSWPTFLYFHAIFMKIWPNKRLTPSHGIVPPGKSWLRPWVRTELLLAADEFLDGEFRVLHGEGSERQEPVWEPPHRAPQVVVNQLRQVQGVGAFRLKKQN